MYQNKCYTDWVGFAEIYWPESAVYLTIKGEKMFKNLMFHVPANDPETFCLEPQTNAPCEFDILDQFEIGSGVYLLETDETLRGNIEFSAANASQQPAKSVQNHINA